MNIDKNELKEIMEKAMIYAQGLISWEGMLSHSAMKKYIEKELKRIEEKYK